MKKENILKAVAILIIICVSFSMFPSSIVKATTQNSETDDILTDLIAGTADSTDLYPPLDANSVPEIIGYEEAVAKNHIQRLYADEGNDLNKIVFLNIDGSKTMYAFDFPVKYINANGDIQDITLEIADSNTDQVNFQSAANSAMTTFSTQLSDGISLSGNETDITLIPVLPTNVSSTETVTLNTFSENSVSREATRVDNKTIAYHYDDKTTIEYSLTYTGFKEDIVVSEYTGQTEYIFTLRTNGYALRAIDGSYYLVDNNGAIKATIGDIIIFTADNRNNTFGKIIPTTIVENEEYLLTIVIDDDFLADENTAYPIRIDPTIEISYDNSGAGAIQDVTVYANDTSAGSSGNLYIGLKQTAGISRVLMKFPGLNLSSLGSNVTITNATVTLRDLMCQSTPLDVYCNVYAGPNWTENSASWANTFGSSSNCISTFLSMNTISYTNGTAQSTAHWYSFDITKAVQGWIDGNYSQSKGILFKASATAESGTTYTHKTIGSYNGTSYKPTLSITYTTGGSQLLANGNYYLNNKNCGNYLKYVSASSIVGSSGLLSSLGSSIQWQMQKVSGGYVIRAKNDTTKYLGVPVTTSSNTIEVVSISNSEIPGRCVWSISIAVGGGCLVKNSYNSKYLYTFGNTLYTSSTVGLSGTAAYYARVWRIVSTSSYGSTSAYTEREMTTTTYISNYSSTVGSTSAPVVRKSTSSEIWCSLSDFTYSGYSANIININSLDGKITGKRDGNTTVTATHKVTGRVKTFTVSVNKLTIYQTAATYYNDAEGNFAEDLTYNDMTQDELRALSSIDWLDFIGATGTRLRNEWEALAISVSAGDLQDVALDMIDHFMEGTGTSYSNSVLTTAVQNHDSTQEYIAAIEQHFKELMVTYDGDITALTYVASARKDHPLVKLLVANEVYAPVYNTVTDKTTGLTFCVDSLWGEKIEVSKFAVSGNTYSCTLHYTLYDHFGLDENDVEEYGLLAGFRAWYVLQHYTGYSGAYRPFLTLMEFDISFTGTF